MEVLHVINNYWLYISATMQRMFTLLPTVDCDKFGCETIILCAEMRDRCRPLLETLILFDA